MIAAIAAVLAPTVAVLVTNRSTKRQLNKIEIHVDGRLTEALQEIQDLREALSIKRAAKDA